MEKNVTPNKQKPSFFKTFLYVFSVFLILHMLFGPKPTPTEGVNIPQTKRKEIERNLIPFKTQSLTGNFNTNGIRLDNVILTKYKQTLDKDSPNVELLKYRSEDNTDEKSSYIELSFLSNSSESSLLPSYETRWKVISKTNNSITLSWTNKNKVEFIRTLSFDENYMLTVKDTINNKSKETVELYPYARVVYAHNTLSAPSSSHTGFVGFLDGNLEELTYSDISKNKNQEFNSKNGWLGFGSDYFMTILIPNQNNENFTSRILELENQQNSTIKQFQADYVRDIVKIEKNQSKDITSHIYI